MRAWSARIIGPKRPDLRELALHSNMMQRVEGWGRRASKCERGGLGVAHPASVASMVQKGGLGGWVGPCLKKVLRRICPIQV